MVRSHFPPLLSFLLPSITSEARGRNGADTAYIYVLAHNHKYTQEVTEKGGMATNMVFYLSVHIGKHHLIWLERCARVTPWA